MAKDVQTKKRKASVPEEEAAKVKKVKKVAVEAPEPVKKRKAVEDPTPVVVKKSKAPKSTVDEAPKSKPAKKAVTDDNAVEVSTSEVVAVKVVKKSKDSAAKKLNVKEKSAPEKETSSKQAEAADIYNSSEEDEAEEKEDAEALSEDDDQTEAFLKGFQSDEDEHAAEPISDVGEIPTLNKKLKKQAKKAAEAAADDAPGVVYIGRIPHGFYENEMRAYFKQFGTIISLRLARNRKTGASKHIAWIKFESSTVAEIVAKTMDNYLLFNHILKVKTIPAEQVPENLFKGANKRFKKVPWNKIAGRKLQQGASETTWNKRIEKEEKRREAKADKLKQIGYEFEAPKIKSAKDVAKKIEAMVITVNGEDNDVETKAIEAAPAEEPVKAKKEKKAKKTKEVATTVVDTPIIESEEASKPKSKKAPAVEVPAEIPADIPEKKLKKKKSKTALVEKADAPAEVVEEKTKKSKKVKKVAV